MRVDGVAVHSVHGRHVYGESEEGDVLVVPLADVRLAQRDDGWSDEYLQEGLDATRQWMRSRLAPDEVLPASLTRKVMQKLKADLLADVIDGWRQTTQPRAHRPEHRLWRQSAATFYRRVQQSDFKPKLRNMYARLHAIVTCKAGQRTGISLLETWTVAVRNMPWSAIKVCTYSGACRRWDIQRDRAARGYHWCDMGNWCYTVVWELIRKQARHDAERSGNRFAVQFGHVMRLCKQRWPRANQRRTYEVFGDLIELALARGYNDQFFEHIIDDISALAAVVEESYRVMKLDNPLHNRPFVVPIAPAPFADVLLSAHSCHRLGDFRPFYDMCASPTLVRLV